jgi:SAM-dependent methyltransferase
MNKDQERVFMRRYPDLVKYLVINDLETIPNQNISVTARTTDLYKQHLFPDCKTKTDFHKKLSNKRILDVGCGYNPIYDDSLIQHIKNNKKKFNTNITGCDIIDMDMPNYKKCSIYTMNFRNMDMILINNLMYFWINNPKNLLKAFKNLHKNINSGGEIRIFPVYMNSYHQNNEALKKFINENFFVKMIKPNYYDEDPFYQDKENDNIFVLTGLGEKEAKINKMLNSHTLILKKQ